MSQILINVTRGNVVENFFRGDIAVVDGTGNLLAHAGDPYKYTYMRSCSKPIQASAVLEAGVAERFGLTGAEIAVMCASHQAEAFHVEAVKAILSKIGLDEIALECGTACSHGYQAAAKTSSAAKPSNINHNCSGKHSGMLALCLAKGYEIKDYYRLEHPVQQLILQTVADYCGLDKQEITVGVDGCGVPVFAMPLFNMAAAYRQLVTSAGFSGARAKAAKEIVNAMTGYPLYVEGTGSFCSELISTFEGELVAKMGADGVYCIGNCRTGTAIAVKMEAGIPSHISSVVMSVLDQLGFLSEARKQRLQKYYLKDNLNCRGETVGQISPVFSLE